MHGGAILFSPSFVSLLPCDGLLLVLEAMLCFLRTEEYFMPYELLSWTTKNIRKWGPTQPGKTNGPWTRVSR
jgi:hypothetical protein